MSTAADLRFGAYGFPRTAPYQPDDEAALPAFDEAGGVPSWYEAVAVVLGSWLRAGELGRVQAALDRAAAATAEFPGRFPVGEGVQALLRARLLAALGDGAAGSTLERATAALRYAGAPAWTARALRMCEELGDGTQADVAEAAALEAGLGIPTEA
ncbi:MAG: hypothetical protein ABR583_12510 [Gaiellaceae bacterium]